MNKKKIQPMQNLVCYLFNKDIVNFDNNIKNNANSFLFFVKVENRVFAYTMGYAYHALNKSKIEYDFGLKVTLNEIDHTNTRGIDAKKLSANAHSKRIQK